MLSLEEIIANSKDAREVKRAVAVRMLEQGFLVKEIETVLQVSDSFISKWKLIYQREGAKGLLLRYKVKPSYLETASRKEVVSVIQSKETFSVEELRDYLESE